VSPPRHALILTAGLGTRLRPLTTVRAKPAIPVAGVPMIRRIVAWLAGNGVDDLVLNLHHLPQTLTAVLGDGSDLSARIRYSWEPVLLGSAGGPRRALPIVGADSFFIVNGDTLTDVDLGAVAAAHTASGARVTLALVPNTEPDRYGGVSLDAAGRVTGFPRRGPSGAGSCHFIGVQIVSAGVFGALPPERVINSIPDVYEALIAEHPGSVRGYVCDAAFWDVGTQADYWRTSTAFAAAEGLGDQRGRGTRVDATARVTRSILWDDVEVDADCTLDECIVTDGVRVARGSRYVRHTLLRGPDGTVMATPHD
jgi:NDP-sugar pyrophosphorylase family protein